MGETRRRANTGMEGVWAALVVVGIFWSMVAGILVLAGVI